MKIINIHSLKRHLLNFPKVSSFWKVLLRPKRFCLLACNAGKPHRSKRSLYPYILIPLLILISISTTAQIRTSIQSGGWNAPLTWDCSCVPAPTENAVIASGHTVTLNSNTTITDFTIESGAVLDHGNRNLTINGNYKVNGTHETNAKTINFAAASNKTIDGTGMVSSGSVPSGVFIIGNNSKTVLSSTSITFSNVVFQLNAGLTLTNYGTVTTNRNITGLNAASTWVNENGSTLNFGSTALLATGTLTASAANNTVNYTYNGLVDIKITQGSAYYNLGINGTDAKRLLSSTTIKGNLTITSTLNCNNLNITLAGNWDNSGNFSELNGTVIFSGNTTQTITNSIGEEFWNLTINKTGGILILNNDVTIPGGGTLTMTQGNVNATPGTLILGNAATGEGTLSHTSGTVTGKFQRYIASFPFDLLFPIGTSTQYRPAVVTPQNLPSTGSLIVEFIESDPGRNGLPLGEVPLSPPDSIRGTFSEGYWQFTTIGGLNSTNYNLKLLGTGFTSYTINSTTRLLKRSTSGDPWTLNGNHVDAVPDTAYRNALNGFSEFCFGDTTQCDPPVTSSISGPDSVCLNDTDDYTVDLHLGSTYNWTITGGSVLSGQGTNTATVKWGGTGQVGNVRIVETDDCSSGSPIDLAVNIHTLPTSSISGKNQVTEYTTGEPYSVTGRSGYTYTWTITGGTQASGGTTANITVDWGGEGSGNVRCVASTGCSSADPVDLAVDINGTITSIAPGAWNNTATWDCSCVPLSTDNVVIDNGHTVTLPKATTVNSFTITAGGILDDNKKNMIVNGNFIVNGDYTGSGTLTLNGAGTNIGGTGTISSTGQLSISGGNKTILSAANITKASGLVLLNQSNVTNNGTITIGGNLNANAGTEIWTNAANSTLKVGGTLLSSGTLISSATGNTVNYNGSAAQTVKCPNSGQYYHLTLSGAGTKTLNCLSDINGNLLISGSSQLDVSSYNMTVAGNWNNTSANANPFFERTQTVTFDGSGSQSITYTPGETFYDLTVNKSGGTLTLNDNVTVSNTLTMSGGNINTGTDTLTLGTNIANEGTLTRTSGTITGKFERWINSTSPTQFSFPIGTSSDYRPALVMFNALTGGSLIGEFIVNNPGVNGLPLSDLSAPAANIYNTFSEGYWSYTAANGLASGNYNLQLTGNGFISYPVSANGTRLITRTGSGNPWTADGFHVAATGKTAKRNTITTLSAQYCFGDTATCDGPTPTGITGPDSVCTSNGDTYTATDGDPADTYTWVITGGALNPPGQTTQSVTVDWGSTGMIGSVKVVESDNCGDGDMIELTVTIHTLPTSSITGKDAVVEFSTDEPYSVENNTGYTYNWTITGGTQASGGTSNSITVNWGAAPGPGNVNVIASSNCTPDAAPVNLPVTIYGTITSIKTGNWNSDTAWDCGCVPLITDNIVIANTHTVTLTIADTIDNITINNGGELNNDANAFTITGDYTLNGTHSGSGTIRLNGAEKTIAGSGTITNTGELQISGNKTIVGSADITKNSGNVTIAAGDTVTNNGTITIGGNIVGNAGTSTWVNGANSTLNAGGALFSTGTLIASASGNTVNYNGSAAQDIKVPFSYYYHLTASGSNTKTLAGNIDINGTLTISSALDVDAANDYDINLAGNWNNTGNFNEQNGALTFDGTSAQSITNGSGETFYDLTVNKSSGTLTLNNNVTVSNTLNMTAGNIDASTDTLTLGTSAANVGALSRTSGTIIGNFERWINSTVTPAPPVLFPVGTSANYRQANITLNNLPTNGSLTGSFVATAPGNNGVPIDDGVWTIDTTFTEGYWALTAADGLSSTDYDLELTGTNFTSFTIVAETRILKRADSGSPWDATGWGSHVAADPPTKTAKRSGLSGFGEFAFGDTTECKGPSTSAITGNDSVCTSASGEIYWVTDHPSNTYTWTVLGASIASGQGTASITVNWGSTARDDANVRVVETDECTNGDPVDLPVVIHTLPTSSITGDDLVEENETGVPYTVTGRTGYAYTWSVGPLGTIMSGQGTNSITVDWGAAGNDTIGVIGSTGCGDADSAGLAITIYGVINSIASGNWTNTSVWDCGCIPPPDGSVVINNLNTVTMVDNRTINNLTILGGSLVNNDFVLTVTGDFIVNGTYDGTGELNLDGAGTVIGGTGTINNTGIVRIRNGDKIIPDITDLAKANGGSITILADRTVTNNGKMQVGCDLLGATATSTWTNEANSTLEVYEDVLPIGTLTASAGNNTVNYYGDASQNVKQTNYFNLSITGSGGKTTLNANLNTAGKMNITDTLDANNFNINVGGTWLSTGTFLPGTGKVTFNGSGNDTIDNNRQPFNDIEFAGSGSKILADTLFVNGDL
ncbi:MAG: hypothetical protein ABII90_03560, partial [Bacteroidota bacterium]